jgi:hypothetical protein
VLDLYCTICKCLVARLAPRSGVKPGTQLTCESCDKGTKLQKENEAKFGDLGMPDFMKDLFKGRI